MKAFGVDGVKFCCESSYHSGEKYGEYHESYNVDFSSVVLNSDGCDVIGELDSNKEGYLVSAVYSTGDSFGNSECSKVEHLIVLPTTEEAFTFKEWVKKNSENFGYSSEYTSNSGDFCNIFFPWCGYFENLEYIEINRVKVVN